MPLGPSYLASDLTGLDTIYQGSSDEPGMTVLDEASSALMELIGGDVEMEFI
jgi:hypothetical protein